MMKSLRGVSIALVALLAGASACLAADEPAPAATQGKAAKSTTVAAGSDKVGQASLGGGAGLSRFLADADYTYSRDGGGKGRDTWGTRDAAMRFALAANLRYMWSNRFRWQVSPGFLWTGYKDGAFTPFKTAYLPTDSLKSDLLTLVMPAQAQVQMLQHGRSWMFHEGLGGGLYRVWIEQNRHVLKDPISRRLHNGFYPGATFEIGAEHFLKGMPAVSLEFSAVSHYIFAQRDAQFPAGFNSNLWTSEVRFGANYHYNPRVARKSGSPAKK